MASFINSYQWDKIFGNILNRGSTLADEAEKLGLNQETLELQGDRKWGSDPKWAKVKRESERHEKAQNRKKVKTTNSTLINPAQTAAKPERPEAVPPILVEKPERPEAVPPILVEKPERPEAVPPILAKKSDKPEELEELEAKKVSMTSEIVEIEEKLAKARQVADARTETARLAAVVSGKAKHAYEEAKKALEESEEAWRNAKAEADEATGEVTKLEIEKAKTKDELNALNSEIDRIKEEKSKEVYLVDPWFDGTLPELGQFFSSEHMEGVDVISVPKDYNLDIVAQSVLLYAQTRDFFRAKAFTELVLMFQCQDIKYTLLTEKGSTMEEFIGMYI